jgi:hypothetical protein
MTDDCGHYSYLSGRLARFRAVQEARGMSPAALARLPKGSNLPEPVVLRPVLATKRHAINHLNQEAQKALVRKRGANGKFVASGQTPQRKTRIRWVNYDPNINRSMPPRVQQIVRACAEAFEVSPGDLLSGAKPNWIARPRFAAIRLMRVLLRFSLPSIGRVLGRDHSSCFHAFHRSRYLRATNADFRRRYHVALMALRRQRWTSK